MSDPRIDAIARTLLYEGYLLYPYRPSAVKNQQRFNFGVIYPPAFCERYGGGGTDRDRLQIQCPLRGTDETRLTISIRFLQLVERRLEDGSSATWQEGIEREVALEEATCGSVRRSPLSHDFEFPMIRGQAKVSVEEMESGFYRLTIQVLNTCDFEALARPREEALTRSLVSAHVAICATGGDLVSLLEPPDAARDVAASCANDGVWPVLVGDEGSHDCMLASPIVLYDYPRIAPESPGDLFDGTEIDEILGLRILTLTDEEKREARGADERARRILDRTDALPPEQWAKLHGAIRGLRRVTGDVR